MKTFNKFKNLLASLTICGIIVYIGLTAEIRSFQKKNRLQTGAESKPPASKYNITFIETSNATTSLSPRHLCAIESAARNNPSASVNLYTLNAKSGRDYSFLLNQYPNLHIIQTSPTELFNNTPLMTWYEKGEILKSKYPVVHLSDAGRLALLLKRRGYYSDLDTITLKSVESLGKYNGAGYMNEGFDSLGTGILNFPNTSFIKYMAENFEKHYKPQEWGAAGPAMLMNSMKDYCQAKNIFIELALEPLNKTQSSEKKCDLVIFPQRFFYPYIYDSLDAMFNKNSSVNISRVLGSFSFHFFGGLSSSYIVKPGDHSLYDFLAATHCQLVYEYVKLNGLLFGGEVGNGLVFDAK
jgi:lactosylceramide 4-alpha-galactosyltransferase